jgi:two-component system sensor histidine kinase BaeS
MKTRLSTRLFVTIGVACAIVAVAVGLASRRAASEGFAIFLDRETAEFVRSHARSVEGEPPRSGDEKTSGPELHVHEQVQRSFDRSLLVAVLIIAGVVLVATAILSVWITKPLRRLTDAATRLRHRELDHRIEVPAVRELGDLAESFNALAADLERTEKLRSSLVHDVSHELRTPLNSLRGQIEALQDGLLQPDEERLASLHGNVLQLGHIVEDLEELALAEAGQLRFEPDALDLGAEVSALLASLQTGAAEERAPVEVQLDGLPAVLADPARLRQILGNLLENAWTHTESTGRIRITGTIGEGYVGIAVSDNGSGIAARHLPRVFERFYRADPSRDRRTGGAGLGLAIVRRLVEAQAGEIRIESEVGVGTTIYLTLPAVH